LIPNAGQLDLLRFIIGRGHVPREELDGRVLRPLLRVGWVTELAGAVRATSAGEVVAAQDLEQTPAGARGTAPAGVGRLSRAQEDFLRYLLRQTGPMLEDHVDRRVLRGLLARGLVRSSGGWVTPTDAAGAELTSHTRRERSSRKRRAVGSAPAARAEALLRAVEQLEAALPRDAEMRVGGHPAYADDVLAGLRRLAREMGAAAPGVRS
jgi:hypothetical protein